MTKKTKKPKTLMSYQERLRGYEADKDELLRKAAGLPAVEFQRLLDQRGCLPGSPAQTIYSTPARGCIGRITACGT